MEANFLLESVTKGRSGIIVIIVVIIIIIISLDGVIRPGWFIMLPQAKRGVSRKGKELG